MLTSGAYPPPPVVLSGLIVDFLSGAIGSGGTAVGGLTILSSGGTLLGGTTSDGTLIVSSGGEISGGTSPMAASLSCCPAALTTAA